MIWIKHILNFKKSPGLLVLLIARLITPLYLHLISHLLTTVHTLTSTHKTLVLFCGGIHFYFPIRQEQEGLKVQEGVVLIRYYIAA